MKDVRPGTIGGTEYMLRATDKVNA